MLSVAGAWWRDKWGGGIMLTTGELGKWGVLPNGSHLWQQLLVLHSPYLCCCYCEGKNRQLQRLHGEPFSLSPTTTPGHKPMLSGEASLQPPLPQIHYWVQDCSCPAPKAGQGHQRADIGSQSEGAILAPPLTEHPGLVPRSSCPSYATMW